jgi:hypothetical protein
MEKAKETLLEQIDRYNELCNAGYDSDFGKLQTYVGT